MEPSADRLPFRKVKRRYLSEEIAARVEGLILSGRLEVGQPLPPGRELAESFGVSPITVVQGLRLLAERGLVRIQHGSGAVVTAAVETALANCLKRLVATKSHALNDLVELRSPLEIEIAGLAAQRAKPEHLQAMEAACNEMARTLSSPEEFVNAESAFHDALAEATGNEMLLLVARSLREAFRETLRVFTAIGEPERVGLSIRNHREVFEAVVAGDGEGARQRMREHMALSKEMVAIVEKHGQTPSSQEPAAPPPQRRMRPHPATPGSAR